MSRGIPSPVRLDEIIHADELVAVEREWWCLEDGPPVSVERTVAVGGPTGPAVVLVHGFAQNRFTWRVSRRSLVAGLAARGFEVLNLELRGHGLSRRFGSGNAERFEDYIDDLGRLISRLDTPPFVVGHSLGGAVAIATASRHPVRGLVPLAGIHTFARHNALLRALARTTLSIEPALRGRVRMSTGWVGSLLGRLYSVSDIAGYGFPIAGWTPGSMDRELLAERLELGFDWTSLEVWLEMCRWASGVPMPGADAFTELDVPLLVIAGDSDPLVRPEDASHCFESSGSTDKELAVFDAFHHQVHWGHVDLILGNRAPEFVWTKLFEWLAARS